MGPPFSVVFTYDLKVRCPPKPHVNIPHVALIKDTVVGKIWVMTLGVSRDGDKKLFYMQTNSRAAPFMVHGVQKYKQSI